MYMYMYMPTHHFLPPAYPELVILFHEESGTRHIEYIIESERVFKHVMREREKKEK